MINPSFIHSAQELLRIPSTASNPHALEQALEHMITYVGEGCTVERFTSNGKPSALLYFGSQRPSFQVLLNAHLDVVEAARGQFAPKLVGDKLYARGACDMKVTALAMAKIFKEAAPALPYAVGLQLVTDEELGGKDGTAYQLQQNVTAKCIIVGESTGLDVVLQEKGILQFRLQAQGVSAHSAYPWRGKNAIARLLTAFTALQALYPESSTESWRTTLTISSLQTPNQEFNKVPDRAVSLIDIRFTPNDILCGGQNVDTARARLRAIVGADMDIEIVQYKRGYSTPPNNRYVVGLMKAVEVVGHKPRVLVKHGGSDGQYYGALGIPTVVFGIGGANPHADDEYADISTIEPFMVSLERFLHSIKAK